MLPQAASAGAIPDGTLAPRGIAVLASSVGKDVSAREVLTFVRACHIDLVVVDFAWITYHWDRTNLRAVEDLCRGLRRMRVDVAAMYRPRLLHRGDAAVHHARDASDAIAAHHNELCFAHKDSVAWAMGWGSKILDGIPSVGEVILYNLRPACACAACRDGRGEAHAAAFLRGCRAAWRTRRPAVRLGHVGVGTPFASDVDVLYSFLPVPTRGGGSAVEPLPGTANPAIPFLKVCWGAKTDNDARDVADALAACERSGRGFLLWYYEWIFHARDARYDRRAVVDALGGDWAAVSALLEHP